VVAALLLRPETAAAPHAHGEPVPEPATEAG
jgi:hypothetical protein